MKKTDLGGVKVCRSYTAFILLTYEVGIVAVEVNVLKSIALVLGSMITLDRKLQAIIENLFYRKEPFTANHFETRLQFILLTFHLHFQVCWNENLDTTLHLVKRTFA